MKKIVYFFFLCFCCTILSLAQSPHPFKMRSSQLTSYIPVNRTISSHDSIDLDMVNIPIEGLSVTGRLLQPCDSSFVRILLEDTLGVEYVVMESSRLYNDADTLMLDDYCMETSVLLDVVPRKVRVFIRNATITVDSIKYIMHNDLTSNFPHHLPSLNDAIQGIRHEQAQEIVNRINEYNQNNHYIWVADTTQLALLPWKEKKILMGIEDETYVGGLEYYIGGIFEFPRQTLSYFERLDSIWNFQLGNSPYVSEFDWRNRHGKNWVTPEKHQQGFSCWAYSAIGALEAGVNLYYNQLINMDLSEQELISCSRNTTCSYLVGGDDHDALMWIAENGVMDEESCPNQHVNLLCEDVPEESVERISFQSTAYVSNMPDSIKKYLIANGPLTIAFKQDSHNAHAVVLVGYGVVTEGEMIVFVSAAYNNRTVVVPPDYPYLGETYWIMKNSYADTSPGYILMHTPRNIIMPSSRINTPIVSRLYEDDDIVCEDSDGDGYYYWGIGSKPPHCPAWVPDTPDGDDSDDTKGPMNEYGYLYDLMEHINDTIYVNTDTVWNQKRYLYNHLVIQNGAKLMITNDVSFYKTVTLTVRDSSTLLLDGGKLLNADVKIDEMSGSSINIIHNGIIERRENSSFLVPLGNKMKINYGKIL